VAAHTAVQEVWRVVRSMVSGGVVLDVGLPLFTAKDWVTSLHEGSVALHAAFINGSLRGCEE
jgi:hypothetical protein